MDRWDLCIKTGARSHWLLTQEGRGERLDWSVLRDHHHHDDLAQEDGHA